MRILPKLLQKHEQYVRGMERRFRRLYYRLRLRSLGKGCQISSNVLVYNGENVSIGNDVIINEFAIIQGGPEPLTIGNRVHIAYGATILTGNINDTNSSQHKYASVVIMDNAVIGARSIILPGITVGTGSVVAAGALVTQDVPSYVTVFGNPARIIKRHKSSEALACSEEAE